MLRRNPWHIRVGADKAQLESALSNYEIWFSGYTTLTASLCRDALVESFRSLRGDYLVETTMPSLVLCVFKVLPFLIGVGKSVKAGTTLKPLTKGEILTITGILKRKHVQDFFD